MVITKNKAKQQKGFANILILISLTIVTVALPFVAKLVQERQETRIEASYSSWGACNRACTCNNGQCIDEQIYWRCYCPPALPTIVTPPPPIVTLEPTKKLSKPSKPKATPTAGCIANGGTCSYGSVCCSKYCYIADASAYYGVCADNPLNTPIPTPTTTSNLTTPAPTITSTLPTLSCTNPDGNENDTYCYNDTKETCDCSGSGCEWRPTTCAYGCSGGQCNPAPAPTTPVSVCALGEKYCEGKDLFTCVPIEIAGLEIYSWHSQTCSFGCRWQSCCGEKNQSCCHGNVCRSGLSCINNVCQTAPATPSCSDRCTSSFQCRTWCNDSRYQCRGGYCSISIPTSTPIPTPTTAPACKTNGETCSYNSQCCSGNCYIADASAHYGVCADNPLNTPIPTPTLILVPTVIPDEGSCAGKSEGDCCAADKICKRTLFWLNCQSCGTDKTCSQGQGCIETPAAVTHYSIENENCIENPNGIFVSLAECVDYLNSTDTSRITPTPTTAPACMANGGTCSYGSQCCSTYCSITDASAHYGVCADNPLNTPIPTPTSAIEPGYRCDGNVLIYQGQPVETCEHGCSSGQCNPAPTPTAPIVTPEPGYRCFGNVLIYQGQSVETCEYGCNPTTSSCNPMPASLACGNEAEGTKRCSPDGFYSQECQEGRWTNLQFCPSGCSNASCVTICSPGETKCLSTKVSGTCNWNGTKWNSKDCSLTYCDSSVGLCAVIQASSFDPRTAECPDGYTRYSGEAGIPICITPSELATRKKGEMVSLAVVGAVIAAPFVAAAAPAVVPYLAQTALTAGPALTTAGLTTARVSTGLLATGMAGQIGTDVYRNVTGGATDVVEAVDYYTNMAGQFGSAGAALGPGMFYGGQAITAAGKAFAGQFASGAAVRGGGTYTSGSGKEKLIIDPKKDPLLQRYLNDAHSYISEQRTSRSISRVPLATEYVAKSIQYDFSEGHVAKGQFYAQGGGKAYLGQFTNANIGVCREKAAALHAVLAEVGKESQMVTGYVEGGVAKHAWVELIDTITGQVMVADPTLSGKANFMSQQQAYEELYHGVSRISRFTFVKP